jgi:hypothetical protein
MPQQQPTSSEILLLPLTTLCINIKGYEIGEPVQLECRDLRTDQWVAGPLCAEVSFHALDSLSIVHAHVHMFTCCV